ncbi:MAG: hypothetical protein WC222_11615 [Parachlamydiales bacterium]|jgi:hypothetical protein
MKKNTKYIIAFWIVYLILSMFQAIAQDTLKVTFYVKDTTCHIEQVYTVSNDNDSLSNEQSNEWIQIIPGYIINEIYCDIFYKEIDRKFKILNFQIKQP